MLAAPSSPMSATTASVAEFVATVSAESVAELIFQPSYLEITSSGASASARSGVPQVALRVDGTVPAHMSSTFVPEDQATRSVSESCVGSDVDAVLARASERGTCISEGGAPALHRSRRVGSCRGDRSTCTSGEVHLTSSCQTSGRNLRMRGKCARRRRHWRSALRQSQP